MEVQQLILKDASIFFLEEEVWLKDKRSNGSYEVNTVVQPIVKWLELILNCKCLLKHKSEAIKMTLHFQHFFLEILKV